jgi:hypothetical protein
MIATLGAAVPACGDDTEQTIRWLPDTLTLIQKGGGYGRIIRLQDSRLLCAYSHGPQIRIRTSADNGRTWDPETTVTHYAHGNATNAEAIQLRDSTILVGINGRPNDKKTPFTIQCARSTDGGVTWSEPVTVHTAGTTFETGCWEPSFLELPDGTVQIYFANEGAFPKSHEQEIAMASSTDGGVTWGDPKRITFRARHRDGMPVPLLLQDGKTIVLAIEDNGLLGSFKPVLCRTEASAPWRNAPISGNSPDRYNPLVTAFAADVYAGAPYICQTSAGHTVLSFQHRDQPVPKGTSWTTLTHVAACVGDPNARRFGAPSFPLASVGNPKSLWNSVFAKNGDTVTVVTSATIEGVGGLWAIDGRIVPVEE